MNTHRIIIHVQKNHMCPDLIKCFIIYGHLFSLYTHNHFRFLLYFYSSCLCPHQSLYFSLFHVSPPCLCLCLLVFSCLSLLNLVFRGVALGAGGQMHTCSYSRLTKLQYKDSRLSVILCQVVQPTSVVVISADSWVSV